MMTKNMRNLLNLDMVKFISEVSFLEQSKKNS
jgi:hypothetical protein